MSVTRRDLLAAALAATALRVTAGENHASFDDCDGLGLAALVRLKKASPDELLDWAIRSTETINPKLNCIAHKHYDAARAQIRAGLPEGAFRGVPFLLKDLSVTLAGTVTTNGSLIFEDRVASDDTELVARYKRAGLVIFGKTTSPEFGLGATTESKAFGQTHNPWNTARVAGGSSGGSAAAVAGGIVPMAQGSDGGGSLRIPASCNGVFALKPSRGRIPNGPGVTETWFGLSVKHALTRSVRDSAALMDATCGAERGSRYDAPPPPPRGFLADMRQSPGTLRIALMLQEESGIALDPECVTAAHAAARLCESLGHRVEEGAPIVHIGALRAGFTAVVTSAIAQTVRDRGNERARPVTADEIDAVPWWFAQEGQRTSGLAVTDANVSFQKAAAATAQFMANFDVLMTPTLAKPPVLLGALSNSAADAPALRKLMSTFSPFTAIANCTGQPAMSVPLHWTADGLPVGIMFTGRYGDEATLFRLARQLEQAQPWAKRRPPI